MSGMGRALFGWAVIAAASSYASAAVVGRMTPAEPLTVARIEREEPPNRSAWLAYLARSEAAKRTDKAVLAAERRAGPVLPAPAPEAGRREPGMPLRRDPAWYASEEARRIADNIVSFQTPTGGWGKNQNRTARPRAPGQHFVAADGRAGAVAAQDGAGGWNFVGTLDNDATTCELRFLARVQAQAPGDRGDRYRDAFLKGVRYLLQAQFPNGGWPQVYPLQGGYHDALTLNDDATVNATALLQDVGLGREDFANVPDAVRLAARGAADRALRRLLDLQVTVDGQRTVWAQQYDALTLRPVAARNFEPAALATGESAGVLHFLMSQPDPSPRMREAIDAGVAWFRDHALADVEWTAPLPGEGRRLVRKAGAGLWWSRFHDIGTGKPVFGDRDRTVHDDVNEISLERRNGYAWFNTSGRRLVAAHDRWRRRVAGSGGQAGAARDSLTDR